MAQERSSGAKRLSHGNTDRVTHPMGMWHLRKACCSRSSVKYDPKRKTHAHLARSCRRHRPSSVVTPAAVAWPERHPAELGHHACIGWCRARRRIDRIPSLLVPSHTSRKRFGLWALHSQICPQPRYATRWPHSPHVTECGQRAFCAGYGPIWLWSARSFARRRSRKNRGRGWHYCDGCRARARRPRVCE